MVKQSSKNRIFNICQKNNLDIDKIIRIEEGRTNETYLIISNGNKYCIRLTGEGTNSYINRDDEVFNIKVASNIGVAPKLYYYSSDYDFLIEYIDSYTILDKMSICHKDILNSVIDVLKKLHNSDCEFKNKFDILENINVYKNELKKLNFTYPNEFLKYEDKLLNKIEAFVLSDNDPIVPCHIDNYFGNILIEENKATLIDWEYAGMSTILCDLANLALINDLDEDTEKLILNTYYNHKEINYKKFYLYKMSISFMWTYWHLIKLHEGFDTEYNSRRWKERLAISINLYNKYGGELI